MAPTLVRSAFALLSTSLLLLSQVEAGSNDYANYLIKRDPVVSTNINSNWTHLGCYTDNVGSRSLSQANTDSDTMTEEKCIDYCSAAGFPYAGVEYSRECFCGIYLSAAATKAADTDCNMACTGNNNEVCGGPSRLNVFHNKNDVQSANSGPVHNPGVNDWGFLGCYPDSVATRTLPVGSQGIAKMSVAACTTYCKNNGYTFAGLEYANECFCGTALSDSAKAPDGLTGCNMLCGGNSSEYCGGPNRMDVYGLGKRSIFAPDWDSLGCYTDSTAKRTLRFGVDVKGGLNNMTAQNCQAACFAQGYNIAGTEYAQECFCDTQISNGGGPAPDGNTGCNMACKGDPKSLCGGPDRLNVYKYAVGSSTSSSTTSSATAAPTGAALQNWHAAGCYSDNTGTRTLRYAVGVVGGAANMTGPNCQSACFAAGYNISGTEYAQECWCDNSYNNGGAPAASGCNMPCKGDTTNMCGGPDRLSVFTYYIGNDTTTTTSAPATTSPPATTVAPTTTTIATTTTMTPKVNISSIPGNWTYRGCYVDGVNGRIVTPGFQDPGKLTIESCISSCQQNGFTVAGMEYYRECYCGNAIVNGGKPANANSECNTPCDGDSTEMCGGASRMTIFASGNLTTYQPPTAKSTNLPGSWKYQGCAKDGTPDRVMPYQIEMTKNLTVANCLNLCHQYGYDAASMEFGTQCFCGDDADRIAANQGFWPDGGNNCNTPCPAEPEALCGGANAMNYYTWAGLNEWPQATGDDAGQYKFLIGGVVIPLITSVGLNNKVMFTEKHGTGPDNSTGAFEFDPYYSNNFDKAWRTLHGVKTDVFCSAGLTLPDKAGRILNIGGWSGDSTYGLRLYTPDGSPGQPSYNDWQENFEKVKLLAGRWYPGAMQLVNGSILVVGGETGANAPSQPTLEVVPTPPGVTKAQYAKWIEDTDPYSLYPFLAVLPSGGVAAFYYNEARILNENTLETDRSLPNMPGAVNNFLAGRTYPLEGTAMLMPQYAPYTDPLGVLICGGSTPYGGHALDNCVTIQPEVPNANWTIERMPTPRVISCMAALPDGTFLIANGAKEGVAGFGLADKPNLEALLYDPSKPLNRRITRLAQTSIARMYHSEAILMPDGTVLISGSDPEDQGKHPQEYRVESFIPPYLMGNKAATRPDFVWGTSPSSNVSAQQNTKPSFDYGSSFSISVNSTVSKISLMRAVSSTHGNSMGQRTIFPAFSCSGTGSGASYTTTCSITAPPNGHVAGGPGWWQLYVLNSNGTPSWGQWLRIGGDPAGIGNWPANQPDFTPPGV